MPNTVIRAMGEILLLRGGPQNLPTSYSLLGLSIFLFLPSVAANLHLRGLPPLPALEAAVTIMVVLVMYLRELLRSRKTLNRMPQTLTALALIGGLSNLAALPFLKTLEPFMPQINSGNLDPTVLPHGPILMLVVLLVWAVSINSHILKVALDLRWPAAVLLVLIYELLSSFIVGLMFGHTIPTPAVN